MTNELRAAAERVIQQGDSSVYWHSPQAITDSEKLARAYLAEHPADGGEPITEEWLQSVGFEPRKGSKFHFVYDAAPYMTIMWDYREDELMIGHAQTWKRLGDNRTRGDVRRLCRALGIELKDTKGYKVMCPNHAKSQPTTGCLRCIIADMEESIHKIDLALVPDENNISLYDVDLDHKRVSKSASDEIARLRDRDAKLVELMRRVEWIIDFDESSIPRLSCPRLSCRFCGWEKRLGHHPNCELAAILSKTDKHKKGA